MDDMDRVLEELCRYLRGGRLLRRTDVDDLPRWADYLSHDVQAKLDELDKLKAEKAKGKAS
jgi:hypothetical protein